MVDVDNLQAFSAPGADGTDPVGDAPENDGGERDDDELVRNANNKIAKWQATSGTPSLTQVQELFHELDLRGCQPHGPRQDSGCRHRGLRCAAGREARVGHHLESDCKIVCGGVRASGARETWRNQQAALTPAQKAKLREALWPAVSDLAPASDLMDRVVRQVQSMGVVNERELIVLTYIAATSRVLEHPVNVLAKRASGGGKWFTETRTLELIGPDFVNHLTSSSALSLVYDDRPLAHTVLFIGEANQLQADENSTFAMLVRTLISEGRIVHQTTVEDPNWPNRSARRAYRARRSNHARRHHHRRASRRE